jgi:hypothetical protein
VIVRIPAWAANAILVLSHVYWGAGYAFGPPRLTGSGSFTVALTWAPATVWGWLFLAGGALTLAAPWLARWGSAAVHTLASLPLLGFAAALAGAQIAGTSEGWGGLLAFLLVAALHALLAAARLHPEATRA